VWSYIFARDEDPITLGCLQVNIAAIIYFIMCFIGGGDFSFKINTIVVITILITGIAGTALAFVGQTYIQKYTTPSHVAIIFILEPVFGAVDGTIEMISSMKAIGCILFIASMLLTEICSRRSTAT